MMIDDDDDRLYLSCINPITISLGLSLWLIIADMIILMYVLATA